MKNIHSYALAVLFCIAANPATADDESDADQRSKDIVVNGTRTPAYIQELGSSISVLDGTRIEQRQTPVISDVLRDIPGLAVSRSGGVGANTQIRIRGAEANHTLFFIDGIEATDPATGSEFDFGNMLSFDVERIEVVRGAQSSLYGSEAIGGVIALTTKRGKKGRQLEALAQGGNNGTYQIASAVGGGTELITGRLSVNYFDTNGTNIAPMGTEDDGYRRFGITFSGQAKISDALSINTNVHYVDNDVETDDQDFTFLSPTEGLAIDAPFNTESRQLYSRLGVEMSALDGALVQNAAVSYVDTQSKNLQNGLQNSLARGERLKFDYQASYQWESETFQHGFVGAVEYEKLNFESISVFATAPNDQSEDQLSFIGQYDFGWMDQLFVSAAVRHDQNDSFANSTTYRATLSYQPFEQGPRLHGSYGQGITNPTFVEIFGFDPSTFVPNPNIIPEESESFDVGLEQRFLSGRAVIDVTYFEADLTNEIITTFFCAANCFDADFFNDVFRSTVFNQSGKSERKGVEIGLQLTPTENFTLFGAYTYLDAKDPNGRVEVRRPSHIASANANLSFLQGRANANLSVNYNGEQEDNEFIFSNFTDRATLSGYILLNLAGSFNLTDQVELFGRVDNLLDEDYQDVFGFNTPGITGFAGLKIRIGG